MPLISLTHVSKTYRAASTAVNALNDVSLSVTRGEWVAIVGRSGSGKSTLMNILGCLDTPTAGTYRLDGKDTATLSARELSRIRGRQIGFVFQKFHLIPELTALENTELPLLYRGLSTSARRQLAEDSLRRVGLGDRLHHRPSELSGGQQQRVAIARAIAAHPPLILADEPTGNLDSESGETVMHLIRELHEEGHTIVLITHDDDVAAQAQRRLYMKDGKLQGDDRFER